MKITVVGLNHKTAPVDIREKLAFNIEQSAQALGRLKSNFPTAEFVLLSTCNRTELYCASYNSQASCDELTQFLSDFCAVPLADFKEYLYIHHDKGAVEHLLNVASSLDSLVIGESQIIAQVKESFYQATSLKATGKTLNRLFHCAFASSKEVYSITSIAQRRVSVAGVAIELAKQLLEHISSAQVAVVGAGEMAELLIRHLTDLGCHDITIFNRTLSRAENLAKRFNVAAKDFSNLNAAMRQVDIIVTAAGAEDYLFDKTFIEGRRTGPLLIIDIAVPRNFHPDVGKLEDVYLYSIDDLAQVVQENMQARREDVGQAREIIADNVESYMDWLSVCDVGPLIGALRKKFQQISKTELDRFLAGEKNMATTQRQKTEAAVNRIVNKLIHQFINNLHTIAKTEGPDEAKHIIESIINYRDQLSNQRHRGRGT